MKRIEKHVTLTYKLLNFTLIYFILYPNSRQNRSADI